ncbi:Hypothetical_protein [Hexamita inflata]|uniref:Hypothetical_protein n=1 Tax=Hexamita inflata TaxID=28002 RepID=A0AA86PUZ9_9EUKA|nr:Hypothetical protein HINF_LOCUS32966 [Hexamita inflata]
MLLFGFFEFTHHCRRCIKLTLQFSLQFGDLLFERLNFLVIAFRVGDYFGLGGFVRFFSLWTCPPVYRCLFLLFAWTSFQSLSCGLFQSFSVFAQVLQALL